MQYLTFWQRIIIGINILFLCFFGYKFLFPFNYEFLIYIGIILFVGWAIFASHEKVHYPTWMLWCLTLWSFLHMAGGGLTYNGVIWYKQILIPLSQSYEILKYDQVVHAFGFFTMTLLSYAVLRRHLQTKTLSFGIGLILVMAGAGFGAFNEVVEFVVDQSLPQSGVGGYINTSLDLISNFIGSLMAVAVLVWKYRSSEKQ